MFSRPAICALSGLTASALTAGLTCVDHTAGSTRNVRRCAGIRAVLKLD